jgi:hypothetical protein
MGNGIDFGLKRNGFACKRRGNTADLYRKGG